MDIVAQKIEIIVNVRIYDHALIIGIKAEEAHHTVTRVTKCFVYTRVTGEKVMPGNQQF